MLIIGHRGAGNLAPENTLEAMRAGVFAGADMLEFDIRLTRDDVPVLLHDPTLWRTHKMRGRISSLTLAELRAKTKLHPVPTLAEVFDEFFGEVRLNIECKGKGSGKAAVALLEHYAKKPADWDTVLFSSFFVKELRDIRTHSKEAQLGLLQTINPLRFTRLESLRLSAVGFFSITLSQRVLATAKKHGLMTYAYTVNSPAKMEKLKKMGVDAIVTNRPDIFSKR